MNKYKDQLRGCAEAGTGESEIGDATVSGDFSIMVRETVVKSPCFFVALIIMRFGPFCNSTGCAKVPSGFDEMSCPLISTAISGAVRPATTISGLSVNASGVGESIVSVGGAIKRQTWNAMNPTNAMVVEKPKNQRKDLDPPLIFFLQGTD